MKKLALLLAILWTGVAWGQTGPKLAVPPFVDRAGSGLAGVGLGLADVLAQRLKDLGLFVIPPSAIQSWVQQFGLVPGPEAWAAAAQGLGAELLIQGSVDKFSASSIALTFLFFTVRGASVYTELGAQVLNFRTGESKRVSGAGTASGPASVEVTLYFPVDVCGGGFRTDKAVYYSGENVTLGYLDPNPLLPPNSFYVVIHPLASSTPSWTSAPASSSPINPCVTWTWNQSFPPAAAPGDYLAKLYDATNVLIATRTFTISPTVAAELVFGTPTFTQAPWGTAFQVAMEDLIAKLLPLLRP